MGTDHRPANLYSVVHVGLPLFFHDEREGNMILGDLPGGSLLAMALGVFLALAALAAAVAVLHPHRQRRNDAFRVLALLVSLFRRTGGAP